MAPAGSTSRLPERHRRSLERRLRNARIGRVKPLADFDWHSLSRYDLAAVEALAVYGFVDKLRKLIWIRGPELQDLLQAEQQTKTDDFDYDINF